jgi:hypothetical protein
MKKLLLTAAAVLLTACGDSTGVLIGSSSDLSGSWKYTATNLTSGDVTCGFSNVNISLTQSGATFSGTTAGGTITCSSAGQTFVDGLGGDIVANGTIAGNSVQFDIGTPDLHHTGTMSGSSISGTLTVRVAVTNGTVTMVGPFSMVRQ